jgi:hypothetical protein
MKTKDYEKTYPFSILMDPNLKGITEADLMEQFELANKIMQKTSMANEAVIDIRKMRKQIEDNKDKISGADYKKIMIPFLNKTSAIEQELYQVKNQSGQDPLNFPIKLNNRLASLRRSIENGEAKPTDGAYKVYEELSAELAQHLGDLNKVMSIDLPKVNVVLEKAGASPLKEMD